MDFCLCPRCHEMYILTNYDYDDLYDYDKSLAYCSECDTYFTIFEGYDGELYAMCLKEKLND